MSGRDNNEPVERPVDLTAVQADNALLDMLGGAGSAPDTDAELARVLVAWRRNVETEPIAELVSTDTALAVIAAARKPAPRRHPVLAPVAAAAAVLVIAFSGVSLGAKSAEPGDQLWPLTKVLYADHARSVEAAASVQGKLDEARTALQERRPAQAKELLEEAQQELDAVAEPQGRAQLAAQREQLEVMLDKAPGSTTAAPPTTGPVPSSQPSVAGPVPPTSSGESTAPTTSVSPVESTTQPPTTSPSTSPSSPSTTNNAEPRSSEPTGGAPTTTGGSSVSTSPRQG